MTEEEAKTKLCHRTLYAQLTVKDHVPQPSEIRAAACVGSACMAWRWEAGTFDEYGKPSVKNAQGYIVKAGGYCGLAGRPE